MARPLVRLARAAGAASQPVPGRSGGRARRTAAAAPAGRARPARLDPEAIVLVRPELFHTIASVTAVAGGRETGGPLLGTVQRSWDGQAGRLVVSILGTIPPGPGVRGTLASVDLGGAGDGERAAAALRWWRSVTGLELVHLGDWYRHFGCPEPSRGDQTTAARMRSETAAPVWLTAIAVSEQASKADASPDGHLVSFGRSWAGSGEVGFYRATASGGLVQMPIRVERDAIPCLPALAWHIADPVRFAAECRLLRAAGLGLAIDAAPSGERPGLALRIDGDGARPLTVITGPRYPLEPPAAFDDRGHRLRLRKRWCPGRFLVDLAWDARR